MRVLKNAALLTGDRHGQVQREAREEGKHLRGRNLYQFSRKGGLDKSESAVRRESPSAFVHVLEN